MRLSMLPVLLREAFGRSSFPREPEPDLVMEGDDQVEAFAEAGRVDGIMAATYLFNSAWISQVIHGAREVLDLGCGPATQLAQVAAINPEIRFSGVDLSKKMLANARQHVEGLGLSNVRFFEDDITTLSQVPDGSVDAVISTLALHHVPSAATLSHCFAAIQRVLQPEGAIYLLDLGRLKSLRSVLHFAYMNAKQLPHNFTLDYERSLRAAFRPEDFRSMAERHMPGRVQVYATAGIHVLVMVKTKNDRPLSGAIRRRLHEMRRALPMRYRGDLDDMRRFFRLGGLRGDPFRNTEGDAPSTVF